MEMNVNKTILIAIIFFASCKSYEKIAINSYSDLYAIIDAHQYSDNSLFHKTISYEKLPYAENFSYQVLNKYNVKYNSITEEGRCVNFDTIFSREKREKIDFQFKSLKSRNLKKSRLSHPKILSREKSSYGTAIKNRKGFSRISYPFILEADNSDLYGFIYRESSMGILYVYKKVNDKWREFARLEIWI